MLATALQLALALSVVSQQPCREPQCLCPTAAGFGQCNLADTRKRPPVSAALPKGPSIETGIANHTAFEHALGHALRSTAAVQHATREFGARLFTAFVEPFSEGYKRSEEVDKAFGSASGFDQANTGWVGPDTGVIEEVLKSGNIREVWALVYALTHSKYLDKTVAPPDGSGAMMDDAQLRARGLAPGPLRQRAQLINATNAAMAARPGSFDSSLKFAQGVPDFAFPGFDSWVRFDFTATELDNSGNPAHLWTEARTWLSPPGRTTLMSDDPSIDPPLSNAEEDYQCDLVPPPCRLHWVPGLLGYSLPKTPFSASGAAHPYLPGYVERANALGYRKVAGPSGTTQNVLQYATYLGMGGADGAEDDWLPLLRLTMLAWMLPTDDHSLYEILLGAEPYMPEGGGFEMVQGLRDLERICPPARTLTVTTRTAAASGASGASGASSSAATASDEEEGEGSMLSFPCADIWSAVGSHIPRGSDAVRGWTPAQQRYWDSVLAPHPHGPSPSPSPPPSPPPPPSGGGGLGAFGWILVVLGVVGVVICIAAAHIHLKKRKQLCYADESSWDTSSGDGLEDPIPINAPAPAAPAAPAGEPSRWAHQNE